MTRLACIRDGCPGPETPENDPGLPVGCGLDDGRDPALIRCPFEPSQDEMRRRRREAARHLRDALERA